MSELALRIGEPASAPAPAPAAIPAEAPAKRQEALVISSLVVGLVVLVLLLGIIAAHVYDRRSRSQRVSRPPISSDLEAEVNFPDNSAIKVTYEELLFATNHFSEDNYLGQGGFGNVYRGRLANGTEVAVKKLKADSKQGESEFLTEVNVISRVHHRHLVSLVGYCIKSQERLLVYEYVPNKSLHVQLHGFNQPTMDWPTRFRIALGTAKGLAYLHEDCQPKIVHRDIKSANILLDSNFEAKVADFGLARFFLDTDTNVFTRAVGTFGYLAPEYASTGQLTVKSDVYSFGVMLLELITGQLPVLQGDSMAESLANWAWPQLVKALNDKNYDSLVDPRLENSYDSCEMRQMVACAAASVRHSAQHRPKMSQIVRVLEGVMSTEYLTEGLQLGESTTYAISGFSRNSSWDNIAENGSSRLQQTRSHNASGEYSTPTSNQ